MRLAALSLLLGCMALGCEDDGPSEPPPSRVVAVAADPHEGPSLEDLCDVGLTGEPATFTLPELAGAAPESASSGSWRWVNVWATWCAPCVEEMPRLVGWERRLTREAAPIRLVFLSADNDDETVAAFRQEHPDVPDSARVADPSGVASWATTVGLDEGATLPIHAFVDPEDRVRCARAGAVGDDDYAAVHALLTRD